jgi:hypothetical protein
MNKIILASLLAVLTLNVDAKIDLKSVMDKVGSSSTSTPSNNNSGVNSISDTEANDGLKAALNQGVGKAVNMLGVTDGFLSNKDVKIPLPNSLKKIQKGMKLAGMGKQSDELVLKMNRAAEAAVPEAKSLLVDSIKKMSLADAKAILTGPEDAATQYFKKSTSAQMSEKFLPIVTKETEKVELAQSYNKYAEMGSKFGVVKKEDANIQQYVTNKALDGLYFMIAKEEVAIRKDPLGQASNLIKKVFGAVK